MAASLAARVGEGKDREAASHVRAHGPQKHEIGCQGDGGRNAADLWRIQASAMTVAALPQ
jgi:hypothetical protein